MSETRLFQIWSDEYHLFGAYVALLRVNIVGTYISTNKYIKIRISQKQTHFNSRTSKSGSGTGSGNV
jgi:hypothetical protein